jgi:hypothetical protein
LHKGHGMPLGDLIVVPIPVHIDAEAWYHLESANLSTKSPTHLRWKKP